MEAIKLFVTGDTKSPVRKQGDAGIDIFVPNLTEAFVEKLVKANPGQPVKWGVIGSPSEAKEGETEEDSQNRGLYIYVPPHEDILIPTYIEALIPEGQFLKVENRSSVSVRQKILCGAGIIDPSYHGEICIQIFNMSSSMKFVTFGQKICQIIPYSYNDSEHENFYIETLDKFKEFRNLTTHDKFFEGHESHRPDEGTAGFGSSGN